MIIINDEQVNDYEVFVVVVGADEVVDVIDSLTDVVKVLFPLMDRACFKRSKENITICLTFTKC